MKVRGIIDKIRVEEDISLKDPKVQNNQSTDAHRPALSIVKCYLELN